jgi:hypothetical protein
VASDGAVWTASNLSAKADRAPQSRMVRFDPSTGKALSQSAFLGVKLDALTADGSVADDKTAPNATSSGKVLRREVKRGNAFWTGLRIKTNEGGQTIASIRLNGKVAGMGLVTLYSAGTARLDFGANRKYGAALRRAAAAHRRVLVHITVNDWAGNKHIYDRPMRLAL